MIPGTDWTLPLDRGQFPKATELTVSHSDRAYRPGGLYRDCHTGALSVLFQSMKLIRISGAGRINLQIYGHPILKWITLTWLIGYRYHSPNNDHHGITRNCFPWFAGNCRRLPWDIHTRWTRVGPGSIDGDIMTWSRFWSLALCVGNPTVIHRWPLDSPHKGPLIRSFDVLFLLD